MATNAYAPYAPQVLGDSWAPITYEEYWPSLTEERGYEFNLSASATVVTARSYVGTPPLLTSAEAVNIYPSGSEDDWGAVKQVVIPAATAFSYTGLGTISPTNAAARLQAVSSVAPNTGGVSFDSTSGLGLQFAVTSFSTQLTGKRILKLELLVIQGADEHTSAAVYSQSGAVYFVSSAIPDATDLAANPTIIPSVDMGTYTVFYGTSTTYGSTTVDVYPWNYAALSRFDPSTTLAQRIYVVLVPSVTTVVSYAALRVTYCNETRVGVGGRLTSDQSSTNAAGEIGNTQTPFSIPILDTAYSAGPALAAGDYVVTTNQAYFPDSTAFGHQYSIRSLRQLYPQQSPAIKGINLTPTSTFDIADPPVTKEITNEVAAITLHTSTTTVADSHGYNQPIYAPVYTGVTAAQTINHAAESASQTYPMARIYARRFGDTTGVLGLRNQSNTAIAATISVEDFDALDEIVDGWKAVDFTFTGSLPTFNTSGTSTYEVFSSTPANAQWQVLGARATSVTGLVPTEIGPNQWGAGTTYGGSSAVATWDQGSGSATIDFRGDLTMMFARMPQVTGLSVVESSLDLDVYEYCDLPGEAIPTALFYNQVSWSGLSGGVLGDLFARTTASGWGTATSGSAWSVQAGTSAIYSTAAAGVATAAPAVVGTSYIITNTYSPANTTITTKVTMPAVASTNATKIFLIGRFADTSNFYSALFSFDTDGRIGVGWEKWVAGVNSTIGTTTYGGATYAANRAIWIKAQMYNTVLQAKVWADGDAEPEEWISVAIDSSLTAAGQVGMRFLLGTGNTTPTSISVEEYTASWGFGAFELQRMDPYTDWQTIMLATSPLVASFNDFEARIGVQSDYRIRACQELDFCGDWSSTVSITPTSPGVDGDAITDSVLMFTSNADTDGSQALAYVESFDGTPQEAFTFFEASDVTFQPMYNRDYRVAFHGTERGGEWFNRTIMVNNVAVTTLNFDQLYQPLRNLAWDSLPYVCVRDGHGSRWFANVQLPTGVVQPPHLSGQFASITVTEVSGEAYPVDPT